MNSFRVINARFRILKGGKIGLSLSVFLLGGMITLSKTNALATDYFTDVKVDTVGAPTSTAGTYGTAEVQERTTSGSVTATRNDAAYGSVVFKPDSWGTYYTGVTSSTDIDTNGDSNPDSTKFNFTTESSNALTLTFSSGSNAGSISKDTTTIHSVNLNTDTITGNATNSYDSLAISGSTDYTANLIFDGSNNVSGATNIGDGNMYFGGNANFSGTVNAGSINVDTTSKIVFNSDVDLSAGTNNSLTFDSAGTVEFKSDLTGDITSSGQGTVTFVGDGSGKAQTITGNIGSSVGTGIDTLNVGESGVSNNYSTLTVNGDVYATNTVLNNGTGSSTLILSDGSNITSSITTADDDKGRLSLNGNSTVTGTVGALGTELEKITVSGAVGTVSSISGDVHALTTEIGANELQLGSNLTGNINASVSGQGTLTLAGDSVGKAQLITGDIGNLATINVGNASNITDYSTSTIDGDISATNIVLNNNSELILKKDGANVTSAITTNDGNGTLTVQKDATISGQVGTGAVGGALNVINAGTTVSDVVVFESGVYATTTNITDGRVDFNTVSGNTETNIVFNGTGEANLHGNLTGDITSSGQGTVTFVGDGSGKAQTITGNIGSSVGTGIDTLNVGESGVSNNYSTLTVNGDVYATNTVLNNGTGSSTLILSDGSNITSSITTADDDKGILSLNGNSTVTGTVGALGTELEKITVSGAVGTVSSISGDVHALTTEIGANELQLGSNLTGNINASVSGQGTLTLAGDSVGKAQLITGDIGNLATINVGNASNITDYSTSTIDGDISATNIVLNNNSELILKKDGANVTSAITTNDGNGTLTVQKDATISGQVGTGAVGGALNVINAGTTVSDVVVFESGVYATTTNITDGRVDFNTVSGNTETNIVFNGTGEANLYGNLTGDINFGGIDATVNVKDGNGILGSVDTLTNNNTGILNYEGDGTIDGVIGALSLGIKELNVNTEDDQNKDGSGNVITQGLLANREIFADIINLRNNATLTLADNSNVTNTGTNKLVISTDNSGKGKVVFLGNSTVTGEIGTSSNNLSNITAGASGKTVTFNDMVYASTLTYSDNGTVVLNGHNSLDANKEGFIGTVDLANTTGTLEIGDGVNLTVDSSGIQFANANDATLKFEGDTTVYGVLGGNEAGNSKFEEIYAGLNGKTATFKNDVYVEENTFHVGNGTVNFEGDLISSLIFDADGIVNMSDGKSVIVSSSAQSIKTSVDGEGTVNFEGATTLYGDIGYVDATNSLNNKLLSSVTFGSVGTSSNSYTQNINKNVYAYDTNIGNGTNKTTANIAGDIKFGGNLNLRKDSVLDVSDYNVTVDNNLDIASNATLNFKVNATDLEGLASSTYGNYGSINSTSLTIDNDSEIHISYVGTLNGTDTYDLIRTSNIILTNYEGTELNGLVSDDSIVNSVVKNVGNNLVLFVDRTGGGSFAAEDLYIVKSGIGKDYSNGASQLLAGYANDTQRAGALTDIVRKMEYFEGGTDVSQAKKDEMIAIQRKLTPISNSSNIQTAVTSTNLATTTIGSRLSDIRRTETNNFTPNIYSGNYAGLSSGDYGYDTSFWVKGMGSKATQDNVKDYYGYDTTTYGFVAGMDKTMHDGTIFGIAVGYSDTKTNQDNADSDSSNTNSVQATIYSSKEFGDTYLDGYLSYSKHTTDGTRTANSGKVTSSVDSDQISAKVESGHKFRVNDGISVTPFASLEYSLLNQKGYTEKGSTYQNDALKVDGLKLNRGTVEVGAKLTSNIELEDTLIIPQFTASVYNSFGDNKADVKAQFVGGGNKFATPVQELNQTMVNVGVGVETKISDSTSLIFDIEHDRSRDGSFEAYSGSVTFGVSF